VAEICIDILQLNVIIWVVVCSLLLYMFDFIQK